MPHRIIATETERADFIRFVEGVTLPHTFEWVKGRDRTGEQNRLMWLWATEAGDQLGETTDEIQRRWKLDHGLPILCEDSEEFRQFCTLTLKRLGREDRLEAMKYTPVTSEMKVRQMVRFLDAIERECAAAGIALTAPHADLSAYHARYRQTEDRRAA